MNRRNWVTWVGIAVSAIVHAAVLAPIIGMPIARPGHSMFDRSVDDAPYVPVERAEDVIVDDHDPPIDPLAVDPSDDAAHLKREAQRVIEQSDPQTLTPPANTPDVDPGEVDRPQTDPTDLAPAVPVPGLAAVEAADAPLLAVADPAIALPAYRAAVDTIEAPAPSTEPIAGDQLINTDRPGLPGEAGGRIGGESTGGIAAPSPAPPRLRDDAAAPAPPPIDVPQVTIDLPRVLDKQPPPKRLDDDFDYQLLTYRGPARAKRGLNLFGREPAAPDEGWFELRITARPTLSKLRPLGKDVVYVIDTSGSISDDWLDATRRGVVAAMAALNEGDRFNVVRFEDTVSLLSPSGLVARSDAQLTAAERFITSDREGGSTDVDRALASLVRPSVDPSRVYQVVFISDGRPTQGAIDAATIINAFTRDNRLVAAIYFVAVGTAINRPLVDSLAYRNKGYVVRPAKAADAASAIRDLASRLRFPVLRDAQFVIAGTNRSLVFPRQLRDVYQGDPVRLFGRYEPGASVIGGEIVGRNHGHRMAFGFQLTFDRAKPGEMSIATDWAREYVAHLTSQMLGQRDAEAARTRNAIKTLGKEYDLD